jgi:radical SAM superfamily enzyme with C-terminal helix-hairpin-helix motif
MEHKEGHVTFGRQPGTYALLVGVPYDLPLEQPFDVLVTDHGYRSLTGVEHPFPVNRANLRALQALPGVGRKRATRLVIRRPFGGFGDVRAALDEEGVARALEPLLSYERA